MHRMNDMKSVSIITPASKIMHTPIISIIVPVFNSEKYLRQCVDSIVAQTYKDYELLLIDDGSFDSSGMICDEYEKQYSWVRTFHNENMGSSGARLFGYKEARGQYIVAIDSDDWIETDYLSNMVDVANNTDSDIVMTAYWEDNDRECRFIENKPSSYDPIDWQLDFLLNRCHAGQWNKLVKKEIIEPSKIIVPRYGYYEDMVIAISCLRNCRKVVYDNRAQYHYRFNPKSMTNDRDVLKRSMMLKEMLLNMKDLMDHLTQEELRRLKIPILIRINNEKLKMVRNYTKEFNRYKDVVCGIVPESSSAIQVKGFTTFARYCALKGWILPYKLICKN